MRVHHTVPDAIDLAFRERLAGAIRKYERKQAEFASSLEEFSSWRIDEDAATLALSAESRADAIFSIVPIGTYLPQVTEWAWAWANDSFPTPARSAGEHVKALASITSYQIFVNPSFHASIEELDELGALALEHFQARAVFKVKDSEPWIFYAVK